MKPLASGCTFRLLELLLVVAWVLGWLAVAMVVLLPLAGALGARPFFTIAVDTKSDETPIDVAGPGGDWKLESTGAKLTTPPSLTWIASLVALPFLALYLLLLWQFRGILRSLGHGSPFVPENARRLRRIGLMALGFEGLRTVVMFAVVRPAVARLHGEGLSLRAVVSLDWSILFFGLAMLVLAEVFRRGTAMREELELTV